MTPSSRLEPAALDMVLDRLLSSYPDAPIAAINQTGLFVPMPTSVPLARHHVIHNHATALELVVPEDMSTVIDTWTLARDTGSAKGAVRLKSQPDQEIYIHYIDATHRYGVYIGLLEMVSSDDLMAAFDATTPLRPKVAMVRKNEMAFVLGVDEATTQILGWTAEEMVGQRSLQFIEYRRRLVRRPRSRQRRPGGPRRRGDVRLQAPPRRAANHHASRLTGKFCFSFKEKILFLNCAGALGRHSQTSHLTVNR